jgi:integrase
MATIKKGYSVRHYGRSRTKKNGRKYKDWYVIVSLNGKEIETTRANPNTEAAAKKLKFQKMQELHVGDYVASVDDMTFGEVAKRHREYFEGRTQGPNADREEGTLESVETILRLHLLPKFGHLKLTEIPRLLPDFVDKMKACFPANTVNTRYRVIRTVFSYAHKRLHFPDLLRDVHVDLPPRRVRTKEEIIKFDEFQGLLKFLECQPVGMSKLDWLQITVMICLPGLMGLRAGEIAGADCEDMDLDNWRVNVNRQLLTNGRLAPPKYNSVRTVDMDAITHRALVDYRDFLGEWSGPLFRGMHGERVSNVAVKLRIKEVMRRAGLNYSTHILRHFAGSLWISQGVPIDKVSRQLGHKSYDFTYKTYIHDIEARESRGRTAMQSLGSAFGGMRASLPPPIETVPPITAAKDSAPVPDRVVKLNGTKPKFEIAAGAPQWVPYAIR